MTDILIFLAHGSKNPQANSNTQELVEKLKIKEGGQFTNWLCAFLEFAEPDLNMAIETALLSKPNRITLFPYFLHMGNHVMQDIPRLLLNYQRQHPEVEFITLPPLGAYPQITDVILECLRSHHAS
jgi:sirohydrochlorin ferrochelatase